MTVLVIFSFSCNVITYHQHPSWKLVQILSDPNKAAQLKIELAITVDACEPFAKATYRLEGDGPLV